jgi:hypothetical protein
MILHRIILTSCIRGFIFGLLFWATAMTAQSVPTTTVQGTIYSANGQPASGTALISWPAFTTAASQAVAADQMTVSIAADGFLSVNLAPNQNATPAGLFYTVVYHLSDGSTSTEYWVVPAAAQATIAAVRSQVMPAVQAVQTVSKTYVDQAITELTESLLTASGGTLSGPLYLNADPTQPLQAATKHYVDASVSSAETVLLNSGTIARADQFSGADFGARLQTCLNSLSATSGGSCDARAFTGAQSMASTVTISTPNTVIDLPCATISTAGQIVIPAGVRGVALHGCSLRGTSAASGAQGGTIFLYSGSSAFLQIGDPTYASDTQGFHLDNVAINTTPAAAAAAQAMIAYRTQELDLESLYLLGNANQTALTLDGTGNYTGGTFLDTSFTGFQIAVNAIGHQIANAATTDWMNASTFLRAHIDCPTSSGNPIAGTIGFNLLQGDGNLISGGDVEGCATALHLGPNAQNNTILGLRNENSTSQITADAGSAYNSWISAGTLFTGKLTDNGTRNSFLDTFHRSFSGLNGDWYGSQLDATLTNHYRLGIGLGNERGLQDRYQTDYGYRWTIGLSDATAGEQFYQILDELNQVNRLSIGQYNNGQSSTNNQTVINSAGSGAVVLNGSANSGTGGLVLGSGGATETTVATINGAGNAQFNGSLQVGGVSTFTGSTTVRNQADAEIDQFLWAGATTSQKESFTYKDWNGVSQWYMVKDAANNWALNSASGGLDSFKAYQSTNSGDTYINASNSSGVVRVNYESGAGAAFKVYGGSAASLYASFTGTTSIQFPGLAASSGKFCLQIDNSGYITNTGAACGSGGTSGSITTGSAGQLAYYSSAGTTLAGSTTVSIAQSGASAGALLAQNLITAATPVMDARFYGASGDARMGSDGIVAAAATQMTSASMACTSADVGKLLTINNAGASGALLLATITSCASATAVNFSPAAATAVSSGAQWAIGSDNTSALNAAINAALNACGATVFLPHGIYFVNGNLRVNPTAAQRSACLINNNYNWFPLRLRGDGEGSTYIVQNHPTAPLLTVVGPVGSVHFNLDHLALLGRGMATTGTLLEDIAPSTRVEEVNFLGTGGRCLVQQSERLVTMNVKYLTCRQAFVQAGDVGLNESYFHNTEVMQPGTTMDPLNGANFHTYNVNASNGVFPASGAVVADMHPAILVSPSSVNNLWSGGSIKPTGQGIAGFRILGGESIKIEHFYIEGYNNPAINPSIIVGGKNETTTTTAAMAATATTFTVADSSWMRSNTGNAADVSQVGTVNYILYPPDYVYGSTAASSLGGSILKGSYEAVSAVFVQNTAYVTRAQAGTTAYAWPAGTIVNESYLNSQATSLYTSSILLDDTHLLSAYGPTSSYTLTSNPNLAEPNAEIVLGFMPDLFHTWGTGTASDYPSSDGRALNIHSATRFFCLGMNNIEVHGLNNEILTDGGGFTETSASGLSSFGGCASGGIATVTYANGAASTYSTVGPQFPRRQQIGNLAMTANSSGQFVMADASTGTAVCTYNGSTMSCNSGASTLAGATTSFSIAVPSTANDAACFSDTAGDLKDCGLIPGTLTSFSAAAASWPSWLTPSVATASTTPALSVTASSIPNSALANSAATVNGQSCALGGSCTVPAAASTLTGSTLAANVTASSLASVGTIATGTWQGSAIAPAYISTGTSGANIPLLSGVNIWSASSTTFANNAASSDYLILKPGSTADQIGALEFANYSGTSQWELLKDATNTFKIRDAVNGVNRLIQYAGGQTVLSSGGTASVAINNTTSAGTGGFTVYEGGSNYNTLAFAVTSSGNASVTGSLTAAGLTNTSVTSAALLGANSSGTLVAETMSGDATLATSGALTLATVNSNTGSFGSASAIPALTVNAKGLVTAVSTNAVTAPASTLTGTTLASNVVSSSLTGVGVITSGTWHGSTIANNYLANSATTVNGQTCTLGSTCTVTAAPAPAAFTTLTDAATVTLATGGAGLSNATLTLSHSTATRALNVTGLASGAQFTLLLKQDSTGGAALTFGTGCTWYLGGGSGFTASTTPTLTTTSSAINLLSVLYDGTNCYATLK